MTTKAYIFRVWAPEGDDCPAAVAGVVADSLRAARKAVRAAGVRMVGKDPLGVHHELRTFGDWPAGQVVWRYADADRWIPCNPSL